MNSTAIQIFPSLFVRMGDVTGQSVRVYLRIRESVQHWIEIDVSVVAVTQNMQDNEIIDANILSMHVLGTGLALSSSVPNCMRLQLKIIDTNISAFCPSVFFVLIEWIFQHEICDHSSAQQIHCWRIAFSSNVDTSILIEYWFLSEKSRKLSST